MQLTNSEWATLEQLRMSEHQLRRLETLFEALHEHQIHGRGPESRWALRCIIRRGNHVEELVDVLLNIMERRLHPRGFFPITRVPREAHVRNHLFSWAQHFQLLITQTMQELLQVPLSQVDLEEPARFGSEEPSPSTQARTPCRSSTTEVSGSPARSRSPRRSSSNGTHVHSDGEEDDVVEEVTHPALASSSSPFVVPTEVVPPGVTVPPDFPAHLAPAGLLGIWREWDEIENTESNPSSSTTSTTTGQLDEGYGMTTLTATSTSTTMPWWSWSTTTTSSTSTLIDPALMQEISRVTNVVIQAGGRADMHELLRRLLQRQQELLRTHALLLAQFNELNRWLVEDGRALPWNAATQERTLWNATRRAAAGQPIRGGLVNREMVHVLLQPGLPEAEQIDLQLPQSSTNDRLGLRRRVWRVHANRVLRGEHGQPIDIPVNDAHLYMVQTNENVDVPNIPPTAQPPVDPLRRLRPDMLQRRREIANLRGRPRDGSGVRRRGSTMHSRGEGDASARHPHRRRRAPRRDRSRDRSRSRDDDPVP